MQHLRKVLVALFLALFWVTAWKYCEVNFISCDSDFGSNVRMFVDFWDLRAYFNDGKWFTTGTQPYIDVPSEYPQVATLLFGWVHWFGRNELRKAAAREIYFRAFRLIMILTGYITFLLLEYMRTKKKWLALLLFLPAPLYFLFNRFDILPAFLCLLALFFIQRKNWYVAAFLLAVSAMTKWYAVLLMPSFVMYAWFIDKKIPWKPVLLFVMTIILITLPTYIAGGFDALLLPYRYHMKRSLELVSLPKLLVSNFKVDNISEKVVVMFFICLQLLASAISFFFHIESFTKLVNWWILVVGCFVLFSQIYSPQWILWVLPFLLLIVEDAFDIGLVIIFGILTYVGYPLAFDGMPSVLPIVHISNLIILFILMMRSASRLNWKFANPFAYS
jgi:hypothetical protein